jgi:hypothetical protein
LGGISSITYSQSTSVYNDATYQSSPSGNHAFFRSYVCPSPYSLAWAELSPWACFTRALAHLALALALASSEIINVLQALHPSSSYSPCLDSLMNFELDVDLELFFYSFKLAFLHLSHLLARGPSSMVFKLF